MRSRKQSLCLCGATSKTSCEAIHYIFLKYAASLQTPSRPAQKYDIRARLFKMWTTLSTG